MDPKQYAAEVQRYIDRAKVYMGTNPSISAVGRGRHPNLFRISADSSRHYKHAEDPSDHYVLVGSANKPHLGYALRRRPSRAQPYSINMDIPTQSKGTRRRAFLIRPGATQSTVAREWAISCTCSDYTFNGVEAQFRKRGNLLGCKHMMAVNKLQLGKPVVPTPAPPYTSFLNRLDLL